MTESQTLQFENGRALQALCANDLKLLKNLEETLRVKVTTREGWLRIEGEPEQVARTRHVFEQLENTRRQGVEIRKHEFNFALRSVGEANGQRLDDLVETKIACSARRPPIIPKTTGQLAYIHSIQTHDMTFGVGPAGTGKTYLAMAMAVSALREEKVSRIILTRPAVEAGEALGFLPGDLYEKITPYLRPLHDALHDMMPAEDIQKNMEKAVIEIAPLAYMRGRTLNNAFIILDEAQNSTAEQMFMFLTRLGHGSKAVITGDPTQIDLPGHKQSGLIEAAKALRQTSGISIVEFTRQDVVRHPLVQRIIEAYEEHRRKP